MKLKVEDRISFKILYPAKGSMTDNILIKDINEKVEFGQEEIEKIDLRQERVSEDMYTWKWTKEVDSDKEVEFSNLELSFLKDQVKRLDNAKEVTPQIIDVCIAIKDYKPKKETK